MTCFLSIVPLLLLSILLLSSASHPRAPCGTDSVYSTDTYDDLSSNPFPYTAVRGVPYNVSYDTRALLINSKRVLLQSGIVHYPRSTPAMWPGIMRRLREAHLNTVQTYVFWNYHESVQGTWDWSTASRNLSHFLDLAAAEGLFVNLRFGPYVEAEFAHGGLPAYLKAVHGIVFREYNQAWLNATRYYLEYMKDWLQPHLPRNGGNVVLAQVENEYGNLAPNEYIEWLTDLAVQLQDDMGIVFYVNVQPNAPTTILDVTDQFNPYDFVNLTARPRHQPAMVVESYTGWFEGWYDGHPSRPTEDHSIAMGEFVAAGGTYYTYYMYHGGTNFARWAGATEGMMGYIPSYGYSAPLSENGLPNPAKYVNSALLAKTLAQYASTIINSDYAWPIPLQNVTSKDPPGNRTLFSYTCGQQGVNGSVIFLFNLHVSESGTVELYGKQYTLPYWTMHIIDGLTLEVVYDSNVISDPAYPMLWTDEKVQRRLFHQRSFPTSVKWQAEPVGMRSSPLITSQPLDQLMWIGYDTSYAMYSIFVTVTVDQVKRGTITLTVGAANDFLYVWLDNSFLLSHPLIKSSVALQLNSTAFTVGAHTLNFVTVMMGTDKHTPDHTKFKGLAGGNITWDGEILTDGQHLWYHQKGLNGELVLAQNGRGSWMPLPAVRPAWSWYWLELTTPMVRDADLLAVAAPPTYQLNMTAMGKGFVWINSHELTPYWLVKIPTNQCQSSCNRTGSLGTNFAYTLCKTGCGGFNQQGLYHVPADFLNAPGESNRVIIFEELKEQVDPTQVALQFWQSNEN